jgi:hypothetical protein
MKAKQLRRIIREAIDEVLAEGNTYAGKDAVDDAQKDPKFGTLSGTGKVDAVNKLKQGGAVTIGEAEIDEMARLAKGFRLADENIDLSQFANKRISGISLTDIIEYIRENPGTEKKDLQTQFNFARPQIANAIVNALLDANVLVKLGAGGEVEIPAAPGEEGEEPEDTSSWGGDEFFIGNKDVLSRFSSKAEPTDDEYEIEPEADEIEKVGPVKTRISDEDYQSFIKYSELRDRLNAIKGNLAKERRSTGAGEFMGNQSKEDRVKALEATKKGLEDRIATLVAGSKHLQDKVAKEQTGKAPKLPEIEPVESEDEEELTENYEYAKRQLQYRAGIIK